MIFVDFCRETTWPTWTLPRWTSPRTTHTQTRSSQASSGIKYIAIYQKFQRGKHWFLFGQNVQLLKKDFNSNSKENFLGNIQFFQLLIKLCHEYTMVLKPFATSPLPPPPINQWRHRLAARPTTPPPSRASARPSRPPTPPARQSQSRPTRRSWRAQCASQRRTRSRVGGASGAIFGTLGSKLYSCKACAPTSAPGTTQRPTRRGSRCVQK